MNLEDLANGLITNSEIQRVEVVQGDDHMLQLSNPTGLIQAIRNFIGF